MKLEVFEKYTRMRVDLIREYNYVSYTNEFYGEGSFSIIMPTEDESLPNLKEGNYILFEEGALGVIKGLRDVEDSDVEIEVYGYMLNVVMSYRSTFLVKRYYDTYTNVIRNYANDLFVNPDDPKRKIDYIVLSEDDKYKPQFGKKATVQKTGKTFLEICSDLGMTNDFGVSLYPVLSDYDEQDSNAGNISAFELRVIKPVYRTIDNEDGNDPVVFSFDFNNLEQLEYEEDGRAYCSMALVAAEGQGAERKTLEVGDLDATGIDRIELYVDARDIQSDNGSGSGDGSGGTGTGDNTGTTTNDGIWRPSVSNSGDLSWTRSTSTTAPSTVNIKGPSGPTGPKGDQGLTGLQGPAGPKGDDGFSPQITENSENNSEVYRLDITTKTGSFTTPNLRSSSGSGSGGSSGNGLFGFEIRSDGNLWMVYEDPNDADRFYINSDGELVCNL